MKRQCIKTALCATAAVFAALSASAQEATTTATTPAQSSTTVTATTTTSPIMMRLSSEGARVVDITGQSVGRVENLVLSPVGCTEAAIVATPNGRLMPVPWNAVRVDTLGIGTGATTVAGAIPTLTINVDQARLAQAPTFTRAQLPAMISTATWLQPSVAFFTATPAATGAAETSSTISGADTSAIATNAAGVTVTGGTNAAGATGTGSTIGSTATGAGSQDRFGTTATGGTNQTRFGGTATRVPTNSSSVLPPTGRPTPPNVTPATPAIPATPATPGTPGSSATPATPARPATPATPNSGLNSPASPTIPPSGTPATPPAAPRTSP